MENERVFSISSIVAGLISSPACGIYLIPVGISGNAKIDTHRLVEDAESIYALIKARDFEYRTTSNDDFHIGGSE